MLDAMKYAGSEEAEESSEEYDGEDVHAAYREALEAGDDAEAYALFKEMVLHCLEEHGGGGLNVMIKG
jgi:DNA-binding GntR family transcriptional regulator